MTEWGDCGWQRPEEPDDRDVEVESEEDGLLGEHPISFTMEDLFSLPEEIRQELIGFLIKKGLEKELAVITSEVPLPAESRTEQEEWFANQWDVFGFEVEATFLEEEQGEMLEKEVAVEECEERESFGDRWEEVFGFEIEGIFLQTKQHETLDIQASIFAVEVEEVIRRSCWRRYMKT